jgi:RND family efflux transporter MFP subunit
MKNYIFYSLAILFLASCGAATESGLDTLKSKRDSLQGKYDEIGAEIAELEDQIALLDSSQEITQVSVNQLMQTSFEHYFTSQANLESEYNALVFPEISGVVTAIYAEEGQQLSKGQRILQLDTELIRKQIAEVETQYTLAEDIYNRQKKLWEQNIGSEVQYLQAKTNKESLESSLATLRKQLSKGTVTAPFAGTLDAVMPRIGEMGSPTMPVARVVNLKDLYLDADVSENYLTTLKEGMAAEVIFPGIDTLQAKVSRIGSYINPENRTFKVRVDLEENSEYLKPNLFATIRVKDFYADSTIVLPSGNILQDFEGDNYVFVLNNIDLEPKVEKREIKTGLSYDGLTHVVEGLSPGEYVIEKGARKVIDGEIVRVMEEQSKLAKN